jgi:hypothetical protein
VDNVWNVTFHVIGFKSLQLLLVGDTERFNLGEQFTFFARKEKLGDKFLISQGKFYSLCVKITEVASPPYMLEAGISTLQASHAIKFA